MHSRAGDESTDLGECDMARFGRVHVNDQSWSISWRGMNGWDDRAESVAGLVQDVRDSVESGPLMPQTELGPRWIPTPAAERSFGSRGVLGGRHSVDYERL
jgi:hypothetical protein